MQEELYMVAEFDRNTLPSLYTRPDVFLSVWSPTEVGLLAKINPLAVKRINRTAASPYEIKQEDLNEQAKTLAGFLMFSIDNSIFKGIMRPAMVETKIRNHGKMLEALGRDADLDQFAVNDRNMIGISYIIKSDACDVARRFVTDYPTKPFEPSPEHPAMQALQRVFPTMNNVIQYGSSVNGGGKDIDLMVIVDGITLPMYHSMIGKRDSIPSDRPLSVALLPHDGLKLTAACDTHNRLIVDEGGKLIYGPRIDMPVPSEQEYLMRDYRSAGKELSTLRGALGDYARQEALAKSPNFMQETLKLELWIGKALRQRELGRSLKKEDAVREEGFVTRTLPDVLDTAAVRELLYDANCRVKTRIETHLDRMGLS